MGNTWTDIHGSFGRWELRVGGVGGLQCCVCALLRVHTCGREVGSGGI